MQETVNKITIKLDSNVNFQSKIVFPRRWGTKISEKAPTSHRMAHKLTYATKSPL